MAVHTYDLTEPLKHPVSDRYIQLPTFECEVGEITQDYEALTQGEHGTIYPLKWEIFDNDTGVRSENIIAVGLASDPKANAWVLMDTAWGTQPHRGLNVDWARTLMAAGYNVFCKGPEIGSSISLPNVASNTLAYFQEFRRRHEIEPSPIVIVGYSRGGMTGFGTVDYAESFGEEVLFLEDIDPCVAEKIQINVKNAKKLLDVPSGLLWLNRAIIEEVLEDPYRGIYLAQTVDLSLAGLMQFVRTGKPLFNGDAGKMASALPPKTQGIVTFCKHSPNDAEIYKEILSNKPGVEFDDLNDGHGGGLRKLVMKGAAIRLGELAKQRHEGRTSSELDYPAIKRYKVGEQQRRRLHIYNPMEQLERDVRRKATRFMLKLAS